jgi:hypothetical protein
MEKKKIILLLQEALRGLFDVPSFERWNTKFQQWLELDCTRISKGARHER